MTILDFKYNNNIIKGGRSLLVDGLEIPLYKIGDPRGKWRRVGGAYHGLTREKDGHTWWITSCWQPHGGMQWPRSIEKYTTPEQRDLVTLTPEEYNKISVNRIRTALAIRDDSELWETTYNNWKDFDDAVDEYIQNYEPPSPPIPEGFFDWDKAKISN